MRGSWLAALVHVFTGLGIVCALLALYALLERRWELAFAWLGVALVIDGVDGTLARWADVGTRLPRFSGERLDLVIDYVTYVLIPALALVLAGYLPGWFGLLLASLILLSSLFHFSDTESKADDNSFIGFPAIWNVVAFYVFAFDMAAWVVASLVLSCVALTFVPMRWAHPMRTPVFWIPTLVATLLWGTAAGAALWEGFPAKGMAQVILAGTGIYGIGLTVLRSRWN
ncbi:MAG TPA: CDP-alcohol phosphatidyltransferase family protein [Hyphomicrobiaceae bacterium]|nr:CDP-alcohol phosphatidyltransferase family protein [Hyphomicrobiaceae bacterium]